MIAPATQIRAENTGPWRDEEGGSGDRVIRDWGLGYRGTRYKV